jgi:hypothetical protein
METPLPNVLSYSRDDQAVVRRFAEGFEREGFDVWWDVTLRLGEAYDQVTEQALRTSKAVVVLGSKESVEIVEYVGFEPRPVGAATSSREHAG